MKITALRALSLQSRKKIEDTTNEKAKKMLSWIKRRAPRAAKNGAFGLTITFNNKSLFADPEIYQRVKSMLLAEGWTLERYKRSFKFTASWIN